MNSINASSSPLWATASKEWVIEPKPKPGRKPKKDTASTSKDDTEIDIKGRRIQNRAAQRAFRERKQSQLSELQARIQSYEQGEIERNVALQNIAKRLKEENEKLRKENISLQAELSVMRNENAQNPNNKFSQPDKKRWREESPSTTSAQPQKKKSHMNIDKSQLSTFSATHLPSPSSMVSTPDSNDTADAQCPSPYDAQPDLSHSSFDTTFNRLSSDSKADDVLRSFPSLGCGFCDEGDICLCHEISVQDIVNPAIEPTEYGNNQLLSHSTQDTISMSASVASVENARPSILDNLPAYQPPVPIRRRSGGTSVNSIFPVTTVTNSRNMDANCSGDPSNCPACGDDAFGKAFCAAIGNTNSAICDACPSRTNSQSNSGCCGDRSSCRNCPSSSASLSTNAASPSRDSDVPSEFISTDDAWKKLKAHPNVEFTDLSLLAEVVASRSKCLGPRLMMASPTPIPHINSSSGQFLNSQRFGQRRHGSPSLQLVPQEVLLECGRRRMRHVHADGVKEALHLLDAKFS